MKKLVFIVVTIIAISNTTLAQESPKDTTGQKQATPTIEQEMFYGSLPDAIKFAVEGSEYATWDISKVFRIETPDRTTYKVHVVHPRKKKKETLHYNSMGQKVSD